jgi:hypothetical protein
MTITMAVAKHCTMAAGISSAQWQPHGRSPLHCRTRMGDATTAIGPEMECSVWPVGSRSANRSCPSLHATNTTDESSAAETQQDRMSANYSRAPAIGSRECAVRRRVTHQNHRSRHAGPPVEMQRRVQTWQSPIA